MPRSLVGNVLVASTLIQEPLFARGVCLVVHHDEDGAIGVMLNRPFWPESNELMKLLAGGDLAPSPQDHSKSLDDAAKSSHANTPSAQAGSSLEQTGPGQVASVGPLSEQPNENGQTDGAPSHSAALSKPRRFELVVPPSGSHVAEPAGSHVAITAVSPLHYGGPLAGPIVALHNSTSLAEAQAGQGIYVAVQKKNLEQLVRRQAGPFRLIIGHAGWSSPQLQQELDSGYWHVLPASPEMIFNVDSDVDLWPLLIRRATGSSMASWVGAPDNPRAWALN